jgi:hypothetical protein
MSLKEIVLREKELNRRMLEADMDSWYEVLKDYTYDSSFILITVQEAEMLVKASDFFNKGLSLSECREKLQEEDQVRFTDLQSRIHEAIKTLTPEGGGVFVKMSSRSPKDSTFRKDAKFQILHSLLEKKKAVEGDHLSKNSIIDCVFQSHISSFQLFNADEVLQTLLSSDRVIGDEIPLALEHKNRVWKEHIVLRKWQDIPIAYEFRGFVFNDKLSGLCQYYDEILYKEVVDNYEKIESLILNFFKKVKNLVPLTPKEYVIDFVVDVQNEQVIIVELNPFGEPDGMGTGCVMFDLKNEHDYSVIFGDAGFEFRVETEALSEANFEKMMNVEYMNAVSPYF